MPASLRSERDRLGIGTSGRNQIGISDSFRRNQHLQRIKRHLIIGEVIRRYTLIDEFLTNRMCRHFFGKKRSFPQLWKTERFRTFNHYIVEELSLLAKLRLVKTVSDVPKRIAAEIVRVNALRNGLAHAFFPENLKKSPPLWKGQSIFTPEGLQRFSEDLEAVNEHFRGEY